MSSHLYVLIENNSLTVIQGCSDHMIDRFMVKIKLNYSYVIPFLTKTVDKLGSLLQIFNRVCAKDFS